jgi:dipeptidyl aminopeptidase/acylaminoacyl peptidase
VISPRTIVPEDLFTLPLVHGAVLSDDARRVAYVVTTMNAEDDAYVGSIRVADVAGGAMRVYTRQSARDAQPRFSPDGRRLLFLSDRGDRRQVWFIDLDGGEPYPAPAVPGDVSSASFSPDGTRIAVVATPDSHRREIARRGWRRIDRIRYRADGAGYLDDFPQLWVIDLSSGKTRALTDGSGNVGPAAWSADGTRLAFAAEHRAGADSLWHTELWTVEPDASDRPTRLCSLRGAIECPVWSPDGERIAFVGHDDPAYSLGSLRLQTVARDGSDLVCVTPGEQWYCGNAVLNDLEASGTAIPPAYVDDGGFLVAATVRGSAGVHRVSGDGSSSRLTPASHSVSEWSARGDIVACCASQTGAPPEIFIARTDGAPWRQLTSETDLWRAGKCLRGAARFAATGASGDVDGWRLRADGDAPRPCILQIHGGPHAAYGEAFFFEFQLLAAAGYDVVFANPRGSQGYGDAWNRAIVGDWAAPAYDDCTAALDAAIAAGGIDAARLGVAGGSYGGYLTAWTLTRTNRFAAAIAMRPATNLSTLWGTSEVGRMLEDELGARPLDEDDLYRHNSPLFSAAKIETPLLLIHAPNDFRCPIEQSEQMFTALARRGAAVEFLRFTDGDHGLSRSGPPRLRAARLTAILEWFDRHFGGRA